MVKLWGKRCKMIHVSSHFWEWICFPNWYYLICFFVVCEHLCVPFAVDFPVKIRARWNQNLTFNFILVSPSPSSFLKIKLKLVLFSVVLVLFDCHYSCMIDEHLSEYQVMHIGNWSLNAICFIVARQLNVRQPCRYDLHAWAPKGSLHVWVHIEFVALSLSCTDRYWRMMSHLLSKELKVFVNELVGLSKDWIEWLWKPTFSASILSHVVNSNVY